MWITFFYLKNFTRLENPDFSGKYGSVYEGLRLDSRWVLFYPVYFIIRRTIFMVAAFSLYMHVVIQLACVLLITMVSAVFILQVKPFEERLVNQLEVMNECFTLALIYVVFCFTDLVESPLDRYRIGFVFIAGMSLCIFVHLYFIFKDMAIQLIGAVRRKLARRTGLINRLRQRNSNRLAVKIPDLVSSAKHKHESEPKVVSKKAFVSEVLRGFDNESDSVVQNMPSQNHLSVGEPNMKT